MSTGDMTGAGYAQAKATKSAAKTAAEAAMYSANLQNQQYQQTRADMAPWLQAGTGAVNQLSQLVTKGPGEYQKSPYYDWLQEEGAKGLERGAASRGGLLGGAQQKALTTYGQNVASTDYDKWLARWYQSLTPYQSLASLGQTTGSQLGTLGAASAANQGNMINQAGQYQAAGIMGVGNTQANSMSSMGSNLGQIGQNALSKYFNNPNQGTTQQSNTGYGGYTEPGYGATQAWNPDVYSNSVVW
jgi:hypothetical protein